MKVNGYRIELGEVKSHLEQLDSVGSAAVVCHRGQLYAFITAAENLHPDDTDALLARVRAQLAVQLPYYLLPQHFFLLKVLPMTGNGKIDQAAMVQRLSNVCRNLHHRSRGPSRTPRPMNSRWPLSGARYYNENRSD